MIWQLPLQALLGPNKEDVEEHPLNGAHGDEFQTAT